MSKRIKKNAETIRFLAHCSPRQRKIILENADDQLVTALCECAMNVLKGRVQVSNAHKKKLVRYKKHMRDITNKSISPLKRKRLLIQKGGFLGLILQPILQTLDNSMKGILERDDLHDYDKITMYNQVLQRYLNKEKPVNNPSPMSLNVQQTGNVEINENGAESKEDYTDSISKEILQSMPSSLKSKTKTFLDRLDRYRKMGVIDWSRYGELLIEGQMVKGSNLLDLTKDIIQEKKGFEPIGWRDFITVLAKLNTPESLIGNPTRRRTLQRIKSSGTPPHALPKRKNEEDYDLDDDDDEDEKLTFRAPAKRRSTRQPKPKWLNF
ncbi:uncharacterized protein [Antedon mediterranea]|uniref:uncharacterized protein n=1 Tax=Antedon mediterranea TaxID=105859 RepID=UPI003AF5EA70